MLAEALLQTLAYRGERKSTSAATRYRMKTYPDGPEEGVVSLTGVDPTEPAAAGPNQEEEDSFQTQRPSVDGLAVCIDDCSLLIQYPDLTVADSGRVSQTPLRTSTTVQPSLNIPIRQTDLWPEPPRGADSPLPDDGYLVMGAGVNGRMEDMGSSLDLDRSRLEPMSNSVLNGLLERQLEEVYLQHLTDNLARCNSHLENSLLHDLVPPPRLHGLDSPEPSLQVRSGEDDKKEPMNLSTQNVPCSSNFSSPVLRISEAEQTNV
ncbi:uncharacterized protein LOC103391360 [Cynoglossus semilaevis]|uniref:uncharacterized protein LOC103391360 n=1 Tax=Cynoglossus semilaevis TaxID=244447 RepID=UPI000496413F|nr:uncharacterized protein LOC103391360 [Cynoglossus semilaevis]